MSVTTASTDDTLADGRREEALLRGVDLSKAFGPTPALERASLAVRAGEVVAVMGPSGSGKSTLLHCLAGIIAPDAGAVHYAGADIGAMSDMERSALRRTEFGFVFQFGQLVPELTCLENVTLPLRLAGVGRPTPTRPPASGWPGWRSRTSRAVDRATYPVVRVSAWRWPVRWWPGREWSSPTSRPARWTPSTASG